MAGTLITYVDVPQAAFRTVQLPRPAIGVLVTNETNVAVTIQDDHQRGQDTPAGMTIGYNFPEGVYSPRVGCVGAYQGNARVWFYDGSLDLSSNPPTQQPPGSITLAGPVTVVFGSAQPIVFSGTQPIDIISASGGNIPVSINAAGGAVVVKTNDVLVETNTGILTGLLPSATSVFTLSNTQENSTPIASPVPGFGLTVTVQGAGRLNCFLVSNGQTVYLLRDIMFLNGPNVGTPIEKRFAVPMPAGSVLHTRWDDSTVSLTAVLRI